MSRECLTFDMPLKIAQITDVHLTLEGAPPMGINMQDRLRSVLEDLKSQNTDLIVLSGDLSYNHHEEAACNWIKKEVESSGIPFLVISGNHDESEKLAEDFNLNESLHAGELYFTRNLKDTHIIFMDSSRGRISDEQIEWLIQEINQPGDLKLIFSHHPLMLASMPFMDSKHSLENHAEISKHLFDSGKDIHVFSGHYHCDRVISNKNLHLHITPSLYVQLSDSNPEFEISSKNGGYRIIEIDGERVVSKTHYLV